MNKDVIKIKILLFCKAETQQMPLQFDNEMHAERERKKKSNSLSSSGIISDAAGGQQWWERGGERV